MNSSEAYWKALDLGYTRELEEIACKHPKWAYYFAINVQGANIEYCQEHACKNSLYAYCFACDVPGADIEYCQEWACKDPMDAYYFARDIPGADLNYCLEACKGTEWYAKLQVHIMEEAIG